MMPSRLQATLLAVSLSLVAIPAAQAASIIQDLGGRGSQILYASPVGQSFTAESARIDSFGFHVVDSNAAVGPTFTVAIELFEGLGNGGTSLGSVEMTLPDGYAGYVDADFSSVDLIVGNTYTAIISSPTARGFIHRHIHGGGATDYTGGDYIASGEPVASADAQFRVLAAVPVPAALWLFGSGLLGLVGVARPRRA